MSNSDLIWTVLLFRRHKIILTSIHDKKLLVPVTSLRLLPDTTV